MKKVKVIVERGADNKFCAYMDCDELSFGLIGSGNSVKDTIEDFYIAYHEAKEILRPKGKEVPELEFDFQYDICSFLDFYAGILSKSGLEKITGINQKQLWHYSSGGRKPKPATAKKIQESVYRFADDLKQVHFVD
ncbi:MAG: DNA-binding protein [Bacteroidales bacterium]|jgi:hypothetical protein|nr:DNA-binding protein [Bacteroidales bacterium]